LFPSIAFVKRAGTVQVHESAALRPAVYEPFMV